jgi:hypothetical protein
MSALAKAAHDRNADARQVNVQNHLNENGAFHDYKHEHRYDFTLDDSDSIASGNDNDSDEVSSEDAAENSSASPGRLPEEVYEKTLGWWRAGIRRLLVNNLKWESKCLSWMQVSSD